MDYKLVLFVYCILAVKNYLMMKVFLTNTQLFTLQDVN